MSLINQMLRDLEERRKTEAPQLSARPVTSMAVSGRAGTRWLWLILFGITLGGLIWLGLKMLPDRSTGEKVKILRPAVSEIAARKSDPVVPPAVPLQQQAPALSSKPETEESRPAAQVVKPRESSEPSAAVSTVTVKQEKPVATEKVVPQPGITEKPRPSAPKIKAAAKTPASPAPGINLEFKGGVKDVSLLELGVVEGVDSVRLMFEFAELPDYRVSSDQQNLSDLTVQFLGTDKGPRLEVPAFRGPLLQSLELASARQDLQLKVAVAKPIKVQAYALPADAAHGERLLIELSVDRGLMARAQGAALSAGAGQNQPVYNGAEDSREQAEILSRKAARYLEQGNPGAAKTQLSKALELTPGNVALRQQLVDLLLRDQQSQKAESLLLAGLTLAPRDPVLRTRYGRMLFDRNQLAEALELMLEKPIPALPEQPDYHALLAALEQESGLFVNAATRYRELLQVRPEQAEWWLLLAIAYEQLNDIKLASSAYRQALEKPGLSTAHRQFSLDRLERLQRLEN